MAQVSSMKLSDEEVAVVCKPGWAPQASVGCPGRLSRLFQIRGRS